MKRIYLGFQAQKSSPILYPPHYFVVFSSDLYFQSLRLLRTFPGTHFAFYLSFRPLELTPLETISRYIPCLSHLQYLLPDRFTSAIKIAISGLQEGSMKTPSYQFVSSSPSPSNPQLREYRFKSPPLAQKEFVSICFPSVDSLKTHSCEQSTLLPPQSTVLGGMLMDHAIGHHICLLGPKV